MPDSDEVAPFRKILRVGESKQNAANSESFFQALAAQNNFVNKKQYDTHSWFLNGTYEFGIGEVGLDGMYVFLFDITIVGISIGNIVAGTGGTTTVDVHKISAGGTDDGSIFATKPAVNSNAGNNAYGVVDYENASTLSPTGITLPTFTDAAARDFDAFEALRFDLDDAMDLAENYFLNIHFRPR